MATTSLIEQAERRLDALRRSGIDVPEAPAAAPDKALAPTPAAPPAAAAPAATAQPAKVRDSGVRSQRVTIDLAQLAVMGYLTPSAPRSRIADEFRVIKRPLLTTIQEHAADPKSSANLIMITSSLPNEGKTFVAVNLAMSLAAELDRKVLLVDADVSRPAVLSRLGLQNARGLLDLLTEPTLPMADVMLATNVDSLSILAAGAPRGHATELLASDGMSRLLDELSSRYADRIVVFDAPPLLPSPESRVLATRMGQVALVVQADRTPHQTVAQALSALEGCPIVWPLLNKVNRSEVGAYYGYYEPATP